MLISSSKQPFHLFELLLFPLLEQFECGFVHVEGHLELFVWQVLLLSCSNDTFWYSCSQNFNIVDLQIKLIATTIIIVVVLRLLLYLWFCHFLRHLLTFFHFGRILFFLIALQSSLGFFIRQLLLFASHSFFWFRLFLSSFLHLVSLCFLFFNFFQISNFFLELLYYLVCVCVFSFCLFQILFYLMLCRWFTSAC